METPPQVRGPFGVEWPRVRTGARGVGWDGWVPSESVESASILVPMVDAAMANPSQEDHWRLGMGALVTPPRSILHVERHRVSDRSQAEQGMSAETTRLFLGHWRIGAKRTFSDLNCLKHPSFRYSQRALPICLPRRHWRA